MPSPHGDWSGSIAAAPMTPLTRNKWYTFKWRLTTEGMTVSVDDKVIFQEKRHYDLSDKNPVRVHSFDSALDVKSFVVKPVE